MNREDLKELIWTETAASQFELDVYEIMDELYDLMISKHTDYGLSLIHI